MELETRTATLLEFIESGETDSEYVGLLVEEYEREIAQLIGEYKAYGELEGEFAGDKEIIAMMSDMKQRIGKDVATTQETHRRILDILR